MAAALPGPTQMRASGVGCSGSFVELGVGCRGARCGLSWRWACAVVKVGVGCAQSSLQDTKHSLCSSRMSLSSWNSVCPSWEGCGQSSLWLDLSCVCPTWKSVFWHLRAGEQQEGKGGGAGAQNRLKVYEKCFNTEPSFTRNCPQCSSTTFPAETVRWWLMVTLLSLVQLPWFTPCPENTQMAMYESKIKKRF